MKSDFKSPKFRFISQHSFLWHIRVCLCIALNKTGRFVEFVPCTSIETGRGLLHGHREHLVAPLFGEGIGLGKTGGGKGQTFGVGGGGAGECPGDELVFQRGLIGVVRAEAVGVIL